MDIGKRIKEYRLKQGLTQTQLGNLLGVDKSTVCNVERGYERNLTIDRISAFADALGCSFYNLIFGEPEDAKKTSEGKQTDIVEFKCNDQRIACIRNHISAVTEEDDGKCLVYATGGTPFFVTEPYDEIIRKIKGGE